MAERFGLEYVAAVTGRGGRPARQHQRQRALERPSAAGFGGPRSSTSTPGSRSSGTSGGSSRSPGTTCTSRSARTSAEPDCPIPTCGIDVASHPAAGRARRVAGRRRGIRPLHHRRDLALAVRADRAVRAQAPSVAQVPAPSLPGRAGRSRLRSAIDPADAADRQRARRAGLATGRSGGGGRARTASATTCRAPGAEFSVAQGIYVETRSGWFSDRSDALSGLRPAGARPGHRVLASTSRSAKGCSPSRRSDEAAAGSAGDRRRLRPACAGGPSGRRGAFRLGQSARRAARGQAL